MIGHSLSWPLKYNIVSVFGISQKFPCMGTSRRLACVWNNLTVLMTTNYAFCFSNNTDIWKHTAASPRKKMKDFIWWRYFIIFPSWEYDMYFWFFLNNFCTMKILLIFFKSCTIILLLVYFKYNIECFGHIKYVFWKENKNS